MAKKPKTAQAKKPQRKSDLGASAAELGRHCDITRTRVGQLETEGVFKRNAHGRFDLVPNVIAYIRWLRDENRRGSKAAGVSRAQEARATEIERRIAREDGQLVEAEDVLALVTEIVSGTVAELRGVPAASTRDPETREAIERVLNGAFDRCRARFEKLSADLRSGRGLVFEGDEASS